jgi:hypothetical protein
MLYEQCSIFSLNMDMVKIIEYRSQKTVKKCCLCLCARHGETGHSKALVGHGVAGHGKVRQEARSGLRTLNTPSERSKCLFIFRPQKSC